MHLWNPSDQSNNLIQNQKQFCSLPFDHVSFGLYFRIHFSFFNLIQNQTSFYPRVIFGSCFRIHGLDSLLCISNQSLCFPFKSINMIQTQSNFYPVVISGLGSRIRGSCISCRHPPISTPIHIRPKSRSAGRSGDTCQRHRNLSHRFCCHF